jgi:hypothetical protein
MDAEYKGLAAEQGSTDGAPVILELSNCLPARLSVKTGSWRVLIPPLGRFRLDAGTLDRESLRPAELAGALTVTEVREPHEGLAAAWTALVVVTAVVGGLSATLATSSDGATLLVAIIAAFAAIFAFFAVRHFTWLQSVRAAVAEIPARLRETLMFTLAAAIVFALPGAILWFGSDVPALWTQVTVENQHDSAVALIGIAVQFVCIVGASALPVVLYFIFDRERMLTLRQRVTRYIFRLDPGVKNLREIDAKYGQWLDEAFGRRRSEARFLPGTRWPILIATAVITLGWAVALLDTKPANDVGQGALTALITPTPAAPTFAFLGAYFFSLNSVLRGFVRGDLRPKTYAQIATRIVGSVVLAFTIERLTTGVGGSASSAGLLTFAFIVGIVPETALIRLQEISRGMARTRHGRAQIDHASPTYEMEPLTRLQGIDIYDRSRLLDEGVTNVEGLAHHDVVELLLKTRIPASRLLDWVDQAILFIHCSAPADETVKDGAAASALTQLRAHGIRTATELRQAYDEAQDKQAFLKIVTAPPGKPPVIPVVLDAIKNEDWIGPLMHWHAQPSKPQTVKIPEAYDEHEKAPAAVVRRYEPDPEPGGLQKPNGKHGPAPAGRTRSAAPAP